MCLAIDTELKTIEEIKAKECKVAEEDIKVWKVLRNDNRSPFYSSFLWEKGTLYTQAQFDDCVVIALSSIYKKDLGYFKIEENAYHSCSKLSKANDIKNYLDDDNCESLSYYHIVEMIIPKGSRYYVGIGDEIASEKLYFPN